jgi:hypothetical protein
MRDKINTDRKSSLLSRLADFWRSQLTASGRPPNNIESAAGKPKVREPKSRVLAGKWPGANQLHESLGRRP